ncbi:hypothetical protein PTTG_09647 [Puccinia triticina 1-1 BBBD Race 1]|uniref:Retrotran_gag_3 domain-containing protein n=1 Tax=Puccinia triticina (isolate 1-1 / race 1 (BBBD)) TaxID=630390 RepID=A0A0C4F8Y6_PUCT1|nr:hypothetical protein PTTG_09647 [Puccinia triticina 1-1 BBBD Race 1]
MTSRNVPLYLDENNYDSWSFLMMSRLDCIGALGLVQGTLKPPSPTDKPDEKNVYQKLNRQAYHEIVEHLDSNNLAYVSQTLTDQHMFSGYAVWAILKQKYNGDDHVARDRALDQFLDIEYENPPSAFIAEVRAANHRLVSTKVGLDDQSKTAIILRKLPSAECKSFRDVVNVGFPNDTVAALLTRLEKHVAQNRLDRVSNTPAQMALLTTNDKFYLCPHCKKGFTICSHCDKAGHRESICFEKHPEQRPSKSSTSKSVSKPSSTAQAHLAFAHTGSSSNSTNGFTEEQIKSEQNFQAMLANPEFKKLNIGRGL